MSSMSQSNWTPRNLRKGYAQKNGAENVEKSRAFRRAAAWSKKFINLPASTIDKLGQPYRDWCTAADRGSLRRG